MSSGGQSNPVTGGASAFGQFRLTTFVDSTPKPTKTISASPTSRTTPSDEVAIEPPSLLAENGSAMPSSHGLEVLSGTLQPSSTGLEESPSTTSAPTAIAVEAATNTHNGFGVMDLAPPPAREGKLGPHRDGRVRNPVPRKLKGKTDDRNGNFAVMHMDMSNSGPHNIPRSEAAKRTSENTAEAARSAVREGYVPSKRRRVKPIIQPLEDDVDGNAPRFIPFPPQPEPVRRNRMLNPDETKYEQARLLTLLRSINPLTVVDQICKALAFFGGIPGAPAPEDGRFPPSAEANGGGSLFVGWLSEIFPELDRKAWRTESVKPQAQDSARVKRPRGRPKGSKASKVRKDKGIKKGPKYPSKSDSRGFGGPLAHLKPATGGDPDADEDDDWIDVTGIDGDIGPNAAPVLNGGLYDRTSAPHAVADTRSGATSHELSAAANMEKRRPGRPKGSRNRAKDLEGEPHSDASIATPDRQSMLRTEGSSTRKRGRPPGHGTGGVPQGRSSTPTPGIGMAAPGAQQTQPPTVMRRPLQTSNEAVMIQASNASLPGLSAEEQAVLEAFRTAKAAQVSKVSPEKKKRAPRKSVPKEISTTGLLPPGNLAASTNSALPEAIVAEAPVILPPPAKESPAILPPPKRQRKTKDSNAPSTAKRTPKADAVKVAPTSSTVTQLTNVTLEPPAPPVPPRPVPQGLEAHYEHFASLQQQQQQQQQQKQQKQQNERQQQPARFDQNPSTRTSPMQTSSSMQSSSTFYQTPRHVAPSSSYSQQYPSHQPSHSSHTYPSSLSQTDSFRSVNQPHPTFSPRQQQSHNFNHFTDSSFIDPLESVTNGAANVNAYGAGISRSASSSSYGAGAQMAGFENLSDNDIRDRLLRGIGRR